MTLPTAKPTTGGLTAALERGLTARRAWTQDGTLLCATCYAASRGIPPDDLPLLETRGELFSLEIEGTRWYPAELLKLGPDEASAVCRALAGDDAARQLVFVMRKHGALAGQTMAAAIAQGQLAKVLLLAHSWRHEA